MINDTTQLEIPVGGVLRYDPLDPDHPPPPPSQLLPPSSSLPAPSQLPQPGAKGGNPKTPKSGGGVTLKMISRRMRGLDPHGEDDGTCVHRWDDFCGTLACLDCGDVDELWVRGVCPSEGCPTGRLCPGWTCPRVGCYADSSSEEEEEEYACAHHFEECYGDWSCVLCGEVDDSRMCFSHCADEDTVSRTHFRGVGPEEMCFAPNCDEYTMSRTHYGLAEGETAPTTLRELHKLGARSGIKCSSRMDSKELCDRLGTPPVRGWSKKPVTVVLTDQGTGEVLRFPSISKASKYHGVGPGSVAYCVKKGGSVKRSGGGTFTVRREE